MKVSNLMECVCYCGNNSSVSRFYSVALCSVLTTAYK